VSGEVPLPVKIPPSVVEPVPPKLTAMVEVPETFPLAEVVRMEFWIFEIVKVLVVRLVVEAFVLYIVPLALRFVYDAPPLNV